MGNFGRQKILTDENEINRSNVLRVLQDALEVHDSNRMDIDRLWRYYKGDQPILYREKLIRPEINNKVVENHAAEIVDFKVGYQLGEPIQYVPRTDGQGIGDEITLLNKYALSESKEAKDVEVSEWSHATGIGARIILPDRFYSADEEDSCPFEDCALDPRNAFVVYSSDIGERKMMGVKYVRKKNGDIEYDCWTRDSFFEIRDREKDDGMKVVSEKPNPLGIPIVEYPLNANRQGAFEVVIPLLDALNSVESNRMDGVEQFVQALMLFHNVDISKEDYDALREEGAIKVQDKDPQTKGDVRYLVEELNQTQTQTLKDDLYEQVLLICGMPNRNGGSSTSDTGAAVTMRDGWSAASVRAKKTDKFIRRSEREWLELAIKICGDLTDLRMNLGDIEIKFTRQNYENITEKVNVLTTMLRCDKIHPQLAFNHCGLFADAEQAYAMSEEHYQKVKEEATKDAQRTANQPGSGGGNQKNPPSGEQS